jgi:tellurite resistance protein TehA-like permease
MRLDQMSPGYFALVMSTGIVSLACHLMGFPVPTLVLF